MEVSLGVVFRGFSASKCVVYLSLLIFILLFSLKLDERVAFSYFFVFLPLWSVNLIAFVGAIVGACSFCSKPPSRNEVALRVDFTTMLLIAAEHVFLFIFFCLICFKLELEHLLPVGYQLPWTIVFCPFFALAIVSVGIAIWALRHDKPFEFEFIYAINIVEMVFIAFKLDRQVDWSWAVVFIPLWVVLSLSAVGVLYALVLSIILARSRHFVPSQRRHHVYSSFLHTLLVVPALICLVLLTGKLDALHWGEREPAADVPYTIVFLPLMCSLSLLTLMSMGLSGSGSTTNVWWFALRQPLCPFLLEMMPVLRQYTNVSYRLGADRASRSLRVADETEHDPELAGRQRIVVGVRPDADGNLIDGPSSSSGRGRRKKNKEEKDKERKSSDGTSPIEPGPGSSPAVASAINAYRNEFGFHWKSDIAQPE